MSTTRFKYSRLETGSIRLLQIEAAKESTPHANGDRIVCRIEHFPLDKAPKFRALSYAWGDFTTEFILLNNQQVEVRRNLSRALWHLRGIKFCVPDLSIESSLNKESTRWIWIDALCIDQLSTEEKNHQVRLMGKIYQNAVEVIAWLGTREDLPFGSMGRMAMGELATDHWVNRDIRINMNQLAGLRDFFNLQYWQRMWILQEIRLASKITLLFEDMSASWRGIERIQKALTLPTKFREPYLMIRYDEISRSQALRLALHRMEPESNTLEDLLETGTKSLCSDPRDKVYAVLGLAVDCQNEEIVVDYSKSLFHVYSDVIRFCYASIAAENNDRLMRLSRILQESFNRPKELNAGAKKYLYAEEGSSKQKEIFSVVGNPVGKVAKLEPVSNSKTLLDAQAIIPPHLQQDALISKTNQAAEVIPIRSQISFASQKKPNAPELKFVVNELERRPSSTVYKAKTTISHAIIPFSTDSGWSGYAPPDTQVGDVLCHFPSSGVTAVIRECHSPETSGAYHIVGRAFARGGSLRVNNPMYFHLDLVTLQQLTAATDPILTTLLPTNLTNRPVRPRAEPVDYDLIYFSTDEDLDSYIKWPTYPGFANTTNPALSSNPERTEI